MHMGHSFDASLFYRVSNVDCLGMVLIAEIVCIWFRLFVYYGYEHELLAD